MNWMEGPKQHLCVELCGSMSSHEDNVRAQGLSAAYRTELKATLDYKFTLILCASSYDLKGIKLEGQNWTRACQGWCVEMGLMIIT